MRTQKETDLQEENERLKAELHDTVTTKYHDDLVQQWHTQVVELQARVAELEADLDSAEEYICELKAEQEKDDG